MARESFDNASKGAPSSGSTKGSPQGSSKGPGTSPSKGKLIAVGVVFVLLILAIVLVNRPDSQEAEDRKAQEELNAASANDPVPVQKSAEQN